MYGFESVCRRYQNGELEPAAMESAVRTNLRVRNTFDDDPWFVLHRFADSVFNTSNVHFQDTGVIF